MNGSPPASISARVGETKVGDVGQNAIQSLHQQFPPRMMPYFVGTPMLSIHSRLPEPEWCAIGANFGPADDVFEMQHAAVNVLPLFENSCEDICTSGFAMVIDPE